MADSASPRTGYRPPRHPARDPGRARSSLGRQYARARRRWSDVRDHLPLFVDAVVGTNAQRVVELGSRGGVSTIAWLHGLSLTGGHLWTVDLAPAPPLGDYTFWTHIEGDDVHPLVVEQTPVGVDVLFIDTSHDFDHTLAELRSYYRRVRPGGLIFLHDTELEYPDGIEPQEPFPVRRAIEKFVDEHALSWHEYPGSFGLGEIRVP